MRRLVSDAPPCVVAEADGQRVVLLDPAVPTRCGGSVAEPKGKILWRARTKGLFVPGEAGAQQSDAGWIGQAA